MSAAIWDKLKVNCSGLHLYLRELVYSDPNQAVFQADYPDAAQNVRKVLVRLFLEDKSRSGETVNRFLEATYFEHPFLLRYLEAGTLPCDEGTVAYAVTERADAWVIRSLTAEEALTFAQHILSGLGYLHARNLVYCLFSPRAVAAVGGDWKLSDFSQLRVSGIDIGDEALSLGTSLDTSPPEAAEGLISPAWDVWSFGQTLWKVLDGYKANIPDPFKAVFLACLNVNPSSRPTLNQLSALLESAELSSRTPDISAAAKA
jgi:serine/threonine protein kinase